MPVTLCFIKDKHKVMEHKIPLETYFAGLLQKVEWQIQEYEDTACLLYTSPSPRDLSTSRMPSSA